MKLITNVQELEKILKELKANPIFYAFGENKENFHSSFWKWMFNENAKETILILTGINENEDLNLNNSFLEREQNASNSDKEHKYKARYDVLITINGIRKYIIETKVKSFPTLEQLRRIEYATKDKHKIKFFCIHLYPSNTLENLKSTLNNWFFYDFESLSKRINIEKFSQIKRVYIEDYKKMLIGLSDLFRLFSFNQTRPNYDFVWKNAKNQEDNFDLQAKLEEYKLWELFLHYRSKHFFIAFKKQ
ncbi:hypothetical protein FYC62_01575 [Pedobacter aquae]|uniref:PD-(D/E)XK nuclease superfamily protein n=1 Tax=Pedobacter aquae TaxID=2605747 RepID=A0A5C0VH26_9SPHI|nr:hypothetical protein [Pedobacter aquae]QEK50500.1 hypothetical protein FYC62_01575 [Pedobacter aquae]